jgi:hypothetical protein
MRSFSVIGFLSLVHVTVGTGKPVKVVSSTNCSPFLKFSAPSNCLMSVGKAIW